jgi:hypothetical protein
LETTPSRRSRRRFVTGVRQAVLVSPGAPRRRPASQMSVHGQKLVSESVTYVRPLRWEPFELSDRLSAGLPTSTSSPSRLFTTTRALRSRPRPVYSPDMTTKELGRTRKALHALSRERKQAVDLAMRPQGSWTSDAEREDAVLFCNFPCPTALF